MGTEPNFSERRSESPTAMNPKYWPRLWRAESLQVKIGFFATLLLFSGADFFGPLLLGHKRTLETLTALGVTFIALLTVAVFSRVRRKVLPTERDSRP